MRALIVDDTRPIRGTIAKIMHSLDFETCEVADGQEALETLRRENSFQVVTINWEMPAMDGLEFVAQVRKDFRYRHLPLLMISSESDAQHVAMAKNAGVNEYLIKPCTRNAIAKKLAEMGVLSNVADAAAASRVAASPSKTGVPQPRVPHQRTQRVHPPRHYPPGHRESAFCWSATR